MGYAIAGSCGICTCQFLAVTSYCGSLWTTDIASVILSASLSLLESAAVGIAPLWLYVHHPCNLLSSIAATLSTQLSFCSSSLSRWKPRTCLNDRIECGTLSRTIDSSTWYQRRTSWYLHTVSSWWVLLSTRQSTDTSTRVWYLTCPPVELCSRLCCWQSRTNFAGTANQIPPC
jgi:hypothetical protein